MACLIGFGVAACNRQEVPTTVDVSKSAQPQFASGLPETSKEHFLGEFGGIPLQNSIERIMVRENWVSHDVGCLVSCDLEHLIVHESAVPNPKTNSRRIVILQSATADYSCMECLPALSALVYEKAVQADVQTETKWVLIESKIAFAKVGANGRINGRENPQWMIEPRGSNDFLLLLKTYNGATNRPMVVALGGMPLKRLYAEDTIGVEASAVISRENDQLFVSIVSKDAEGKASEKRLQLIDGMFKPVN